MGIINKAPWLFEPLGTTLTDTYISLGRQSACVVDKQADGNYTLYGLFEIRVHANASERLGTTVVYLKDISPNDVSNPLALLYADLKSRYVSPDGVSHYEDA